MNEKPLLIVTARDPASAHALLPLIPSLNQVYSLVAVLQEPALSLLADELAGVNNQAIAFPIIEDFASGIDEAQSWLLTKKWKQPLRTQNDFEQRVYAVLTGISGPGFGVDEMMLAAANGMKIPTFSIQSAWGTINQETGVMPQTALVLDDAAIDINKQHYPSMKSIAVGSLQHAKYAELSPSGIRDLHRARFIEEKDQVLIGFYGQPIAELDAYQQTVEDFCIELKRWQKPFKILYRPHPKEAVSLEQNSTWNRLRKHFPDVILDPFQEVTTSLCCVDLVVSAFSTCCFDGLYLNELEDKPFNASVFLWFNKDLIQWATNCSDTKDLHLVKENLVLAVDNNNELLDVLETGLNKTQRFLLWQNARERLPSARHAVSLVLKVLESVKEPSET